MGDFYTNEVRHPEDVGVGCIRRTLSLADLTSAGANGMPIGALEPGCVPLHAHANIDTLFNAGTTNVLVLGTIADDDGFITSANIVAGTAGFKGNQVGALTGIPFATGQVVYCKYSPTGTAATTGKVTVFLFFVNKREVTGTPWPQN